jgi:hypothetical protein
MKERPEWVVQTGDGNKKKAPPDTLGQEIKRQNEKLKYVQEEAQRCKAEVKNFGY